MHLEAKNVSFSYGKKSGWVMQKLNFAIKKGERVCLLGNSGNGKSTLAKLLAGYETPNVGEILINGLPLQKKGAQPVQLIWQHPEHALNPRWKMSKVLEEAGVLSENVMNLLGIEQALLNRYPQELSGGEQQRFCIARALFKPTQFLIADEISTMLDAITQAQVWNAILGEVERRQLGLLAITHNKALAQQIGARLVDWHELLL